MKGLDLAKEYYLAYGQDMLFTAFADVADRITVGLVGDGSECLGFDDGFSVDHDFEPGFCLWIDSVDERSFGFKLERAYAKLPKEFMGFKRPILSPVGGNRRGVLITEDFLTKYLGTAKPPESAEEWLRIPQNYLATLASGEIFKAGNGKFDKVREVVLNGYPEDIRRKKIAANLAIMAQSGQYNYPRSLLREESGAAQLAVYEFVMHAIQTVYLINKKYMYFYKWAFRGMRGLEFLSELEAPLGYLLETPNDKNSAECKLGIIDDTARLIIAELKKQGLSNATCNNLDTHAFAVTDHISDPRIRNMHIMSGD